MRQTFVGKNLIFYAISFPRSLEIIVFRKSTLVNMTWLISNNSARRNVELVIVENLVFILGGKNLISIPVILKYQ